MSAGASVIHLNVVNFMASVERLADPGLGDRPFAVAVPGAARSRLLDVSRTALREGALPGMGTEEALRRVAGLRLVPPSPEAYRRANREMEAVCARYAPLVENSGGGHFFLDMGGTRRLFGEYIDSAARIRNEIASRVGIDAATALASNKLVAKVGTRSLRPDGLVSVREGDEEAFLRHQDLGFLPGVGPRIGRILTAVGIREIGGLAVLADEEVTGLLGRQGMELREGARGRDGSRVQEGDLSARSIGARLRFESDVLDGASILAALVTLVEGCGLELRRSRLGASLVGVGLSYSDEVEGKGTLRARRSLALDGDLLAAAREALARAHTRRVRVTGLSLALGGLEPSGLQLDLFSPEPALPLARRGAGAAMAAWAGAAGAAGGRSDRLQAAVDEARERFGKRAVTRCTTLTAVAWHDV
jgi:DNA polymerase-4